VVLVQEGLIRAVKLPTGKLRYYRSDIEKILKGELSGSG
jgi:predicted site-specific integrase-resolvase